MVLLPDTSDWAAEAVLPPLQVRGPHRLQAGMTSGGHGGTSPCNPTEARENARRQPIGRPLCVAEVSHGQTRSNSPPFSRPGGLSLPATLLLVQEALVSSGLLPPADAAALVRAALATASSATGPGEAAAPPVAAAADAPPLTGGTAGGARATVAGGGAAPASAGTDQELQDLDELALMVRKAVTRLA